jgi:hypothetical protein
MTDRIRHLTVLLEQDTRTDDLEPIIAAISHIRGVAKVTPGQPVNMSDYIARETAKRELGVQLLAIVFPKQEPRS